MNNTSVRVIARNGWPLTLAQWQRVDEVRNSLEHTTLEVAIKKPLTKEKGSLAKDKDKVTHEPVYKPQPGDAYVELECSLAVGGGCSARRDDERDLQFAAERKAWDSLEPGRNLRGAHIRKEFREEFLESLPPPPSENVQTFVEELYAEEIEGEAKKSPLSPAHQGPTPATESGISELSAESEEEAKYLTMPEQLKDKFIPLYFVASCTMEISEAKSIVLTPEMVETAKNARRNHIEASLQRMHELQAFNETTVLGRQKRRCQLLETLFIDSQWSPKLNEVLEARDEAIALENLNRALSATKKKQDVKKK